MMLEFTASNIMRTTLDIDKPVLTELRRLSRSQHRSLGRIVSDLLGRVLREGNRPAAAPKFAWTCKPMDAKVDLADREAVYEALDEEIRS